MIKIGVTNKLQSARAQARHGAVSGWKEYGPFDTLHEARRQARQIGHETRGVFLQELIYDNIHDNFYAYQYEA